MKNGAFVLIGLVFSVSTFASDCLDVAIRYRQDLNESIRYYEANPVSYSSTDTQYSNRGFVQNLKNQAFAMQRLIELYAYSEQEKCEGVVLEVFQKLEKRARRIKNKNREFDAPTCATLMARIDIGHMGEWCEGDVIGEYDVDRIRKVIEVENRKRKK